MNTTDLIRRLRAAGATLSADGERLRVDAPRGSLSAEILEEVRRAKVELLRALAQPLPDESAFATSSCETAAMLSPSQERLWLFQQLNPTSTAYHLMLVLRIDGALNVAMLEKALHSVLDRHAPLRSTVASDGTLITGDTPDILLAQADVSDLPPAEREAAAQVLAQEWNARPFDLSRDLPFRALLIRHRAELHELVSTIHHIAADGVSIGVFYSDLLSFYASAPPRPLRATYDDYVKWQRDHWTQERLDERARFWRERLGDAPHVLELPADRPRVATPATTGAMATRTLPRRTFAALKELATTERASLFMVLLGAYSAALHRVSGQRDMVIGTPLHGRDRPEFSDIVGMFVNQLPLRMKVNQAATFRSLVRDARATTLACMTERELPFGAIVEALGVAHDTSRNPLFQVMLNLLPGASAPSRTEAGGVVFRVPEGEELFGALDGQARFDMTMYAMQRDDTLHLALHYNSALFDGDRAGQLLDIFCRMLDAAESADTPIDAILTPPPTSLLASPDVDSAFFDCTVVDHVARHAALHPERLAVIDAERSISYGRLAAEAERIALLVSQAALDDGRGPVGVLVPHDARAAVAIMGALSTGRPYVPLDPEYPEERLRFMAEDAGIAVVLTTDSLRDRAAAIAGSGAVLVTLEQTPDPASVLPAKPAAGDLAYLLYTSGSTGRPKAVMQSHRNLLAQAERYAAALGVTPADKLALIASISFDASLMDLFGGLLRGASIRAIDLRNTDLTRLPAIAREAGLTTLHVTPTVFRAIARTDAMRTWPTVRAVILGGESVRVEDVAYFDEAFGADAVLLNLYGSSEHSFSLGHFVDRTSRSSEVPIGRPLGDVQVLLLDEEGTEDPVRGEIAILSAHTALGYWHPDGRAARTFAPAPHRPDLLLYRTGDLGRMRPDGAYVALGRRDNQLKVRGHRIEPHEIETVLAACPGVVSAGVHGVSTASGEIVLTACIVEGAGAPSRADLIEWCGRTLPPFMVPTAWVTLDRLPLTPSGKVDRRALPAAATADQPQAAAFASQEEELLAEIWDSLLHGGRPSADANFFEAGGHSLAAMQFVARVRDSFGVDLPLRRFFDTPTIRATAEWIRGDRTSGVSVPPLARSEHGESAPLSFAQERLWFMQQLDLESTAYNVSSAAIVAGDIDAERVRRAVHTVCMRQDALRTRFITMHGTPRQVVDDEPAFDFVAADATVAGSPVEHARDLIAGRLNAAYDLQRGPLLRICLVRVAEGRWALGVGMHHIVSDVWSLGVFARDLFAAYAADDGRVVPTQVNCRDHAAWQRGWLQGDALEQQVGYWRDQLRDAAPLELPLDFPRPPVFTFRGAALDMELAPGLRERVRDVAVQQGATPFMVLLAAFNALLHAWSRQDDLAVGVPIAGRGAPATQELVGVFINTLVHRNDVSGDPSFRELLGRVRSTALDAYAHEDAPFEVVVRELKLVPDPSRAPLFQALFNVVGADTGNITGEGFAMERLPLPAGGAQFDLTLNIAWTEHQPSATLRYCTSLFTEETARRLLEHYFVILDRALEDPAQPLSALAVASAADTALVHALNAGDSGTDGTDATLLSLFQARATATPERVAVESASGSYTYGELLHEAQQVAAALTRLGVMPGDRVGVLLDRGREMVAALLGILGAGAAYVPLDPNYPAGRIRYMLDDARVAALVSHRGLYREYADLLPVLDLDAPPRSLARQFMLPEPQDTAYVIYTSGSTGRPKGVEVLHGNVANFLLSMQREPGIRADDRLLAVTTISFDIAVLELFLPLVSGACVVIAETGQTLDGGRLADIIADRGITLMQATPATWKLLLAAGWMGSPALRVLCGGEALAPGLAADLLPRVAELWNMYGPTETTVWSTLARIEDGDAITIGRPIARTSVWILTGAGGIAPVGVPGELCIGGAGVAAGYFGQPDLTAERFVANPFGSGRIYRTGDLARLRTDGRLEHLGRLDSQVKVRGFRIEAGEVEAALRELPGVTDAAVIARDDRLIAYVTGDAAPGAAELRRSLAERLPPYMLPSAFVALAALPLTQNGKVDRRRLPDAAPPVAASAHVPADVKLSPAESMLVDVWSSLLDVDDIRADDNFFELGGHSLLAMQVVAQVEERTGHRLEPRSLFFRSLAELAATIPAPEPVQ